MPKPSSDVTEETWQQAYGEGVSFEDMMAARALIVTSTRADERKRCVQIVSDQLTQACGTNGTRSRSATWLRTVLRLMREDTS